MAQRTYAEDTKVPVEQTILDIRALAAKHSAGQFVFGVTEETLLIGFTKEGRQVRFQVEQSVKNPQRSKSLARALLLVIKAKLEAIAAGVTIFENEFLANVVLPDGQLVGAQVRPAIAAAYEGRDMPPLLPDYSK